MRKNPCECNGSERAFSYLYPLANRYQLNLERNSMNVLYFEKSSEEMDFFFFFRRKITLARNAMNVKNVTILHPLKPMLNLMLVRNHINVSSMGKLHPLWHMWELTLLRNCRSINQCGKFFRSSSSCHTPKVHTLGRNCMNAVTAQKPSPGAVTRLERNYLCSDCSSIPWYT